MHTPSSLLPSNASCCSLDGATVSSQSSPLPPIMDDLDDREEERLLRQTRKLSQIFGELPLEVAAQPHQAKCYGPPAVDSPSTDQPQQRQQHVRFSRHSFMGTPSRSFRFPLSSAQSGAESTMSPQILPSAQDALGRSSSTRRPSTPSTHPGQLDLARLGLGRLRRGGSTRSTQSNETFRRANHLTTEKWPTRSASLRILNPVREVRPKDKWRRESVHDPVTVALHAPSQKPADLSTPTHSQRRSVSLWIRKRTMKDASSHQQRSESDHDRENDASDDEHPPLTEAQRIQSLRRRRKLAHLFGAEPPMALYRAASPFEDRSAAPFEDRPASPFEDRPASSFEDRPASPNTVESERTKTYLALSPSDWHPGFTHHSNASSISISFPSFNPTAHEIEPSQGDESDRTAPRPRSDPNHDSAAQDPSKQLEDDATATFRRRRLRAAKLSRFFGVAYNDLSIPKAVPKSGHETDIKVEPSMEDVGITIEERGWFWNRAESGQGNVSGYEADMSDVIALLRQMPRA
ncbi:hypothetical protein BC827DRAFT_294162 [Russula dissimulans]|nr:hypothetical protein BC827DRAFT_294162 [Russula dissimulans]